METRRDKPALGLEDDPIDAGLIQDELIRIVSSRHFKSSRRGKEFLQYVVEQKMRGHGDLLKERLIGVELFERKPDYATGEDPVVRVQAGDVRRRLESYHADPEFHSDVLIHIPLGSYAPVFLLRKEVPAPQPWSAVPPPSSPAPLDHLPLSYEGTETNTLDSRPDPGTDQPPAGVSLPRQNEPPTGRAAKLWGLLIPALICVALLAGLIAWHSRRSPESTLRTFWSPASSSAKSVLICLPRPIVYRPSEKLYDEYAATHPNAFATREARRDQILPLAPTDTLQWGEMVPVRNSGPGIGAVVAAVNISKLLAEQGIRFELRFGEEATYADMRDSPVVIVGAINSDWATQLTSGSDFVFDESRDSPNIRETGGAKRVWKMESTGGTITRDYGLITRQLSSRAGQFLVQVAGVSHFGTEAASEFLADKKALTAALQAESINLQKKNFQIVVSTDVTAGRAGPPHVVAVGSW